ncbi:flagellar filament capping protein FliD [Ferrimonas marina]|nr:flagellar filament capping protein FliD [Ferrimonas marina]
MSSGINPAQMASMLVQAERASKDQLYSIQKAQYEAQLAAYKAVESRLNSFSSSMGRIADDDFAKMGVTISNEDIANITADSSAAAGDYTFHVKQLAQAHQMAFSASEFDFTGNGSDFTIDVGGETMVIKMDEIGSMEELRDYINDSDENPGVQATLVRTDGDVKLVLTSDETGEENQMVIDRPGDPLTGQVLSEAKNAIVHMGDGANPLVIESASNTLDNVIDGLTIELKQTTPANEPLRVTVGQDKEGITESVQSFIDEYNRLIDELGHYTFGKAIDTGGDDDDDDDEDKDNSVPKPGEDEVGVLNGDPALRALSQKMRNELYGESSDSLRLYDLGIEVDRNGKLTLDEDKLHSALDTHGSKVQDFFTEENGLFDRLDNTMASLIDNDGYLKNRQDSMDSNIRRVEDRVEQHDMRMEQAYNRYLAQFVRVEQLTLQMQQSSMFFY